MRILIIGIGNAYTSRYFGASAVIDAPRGTVLIDCPGLIHRALREASDASSCWQVDAGSVTDIILTHVHGEHCNGLESLGFKRRMLHLSDQKPLPRLHTLEPIAQDLWHRLAPAMDAPFGTDGACQLEHYFDVHILTPHRAADVAGLSVRCRPTVHPIPTIGLLVSDDATTLGWSGDTAFEPDHLEWLSVADIIVHESDEGEAHTAIGELNRLPAELKSRIRLIHLPDDFDMSSTDIASLAEGDVLVVEPAAMA